MTSQHLIEYLFLVKKYNFKQKFNLFTSVPFSIVPMCVFHEQWKELNPQPFNSLILRQPIGSVLKNCEAKIFSNSKKQPRINGGHKQDLRPLLPQSLNLSSSICEEILFPFRSYQRHLSFFRLGPAIPPNGEGLHEED